jgi:hypothetical protein
LTWILSALVPSVPGERPDDSPMLPAFHEDDLADVDPDFDDPD